MWDIFAGEVENGKYSNAYNQGRKVYERINEGKLQYERINEGKLYRYQGPEHDNIREKGVKEVRQITKRF